MIKELIQKVLGREEPFKLSVRRGANILRKARDSTLLLLPPIEVSVIDNMLVLNGPIRLYNICFDR
jgi:hypothetical protein